MLSIRTRLTSVSYTHLEYCPVSLLHGGRVDGGEQLSLVHSISSVSYTHLLPRPTGREYGLVYTQPVGLGSIRSYPDEMCIRDRHYLYKKQQKVINMKQKDVITGWLVDVYKRQQTG